MIMLYRVPLMKWMLAAILALLLAGCGLRHARLDTHESLNATLWIQTSAEYAATTLQAFQLAAASLDLALADPHWTAALEQVGDYADLPPAIVLDLDQTVLDTGGYNARIILQHGSHAGESFLDWCQQVTAPAISGVTDFIDYAVKRGVNIFYNSARNEDLRDCTTRNLQALGLPLAESQRLLLNDGTASTSKEQQRAWIASQYRVLLLVGDNLNDFVGGTRTDAATRRAIVNQHAGRWGREWIVLPNPMFGSWEYSLYDFEYNLPRDERLYRKLQQLQQ
jgi:5'-nucleotidase (lipoprotein e(P4) family)